MCVGGLPVQRTSDITCKQQCVSWLVLLVSGMRGEDTRPAQGNALTLQVMGINGMKPFYKDQVLLLSLKNKIKSKYLT